MTTEEAIKHFESQAQCSYAPTREAAQMAIAALRSQPVKLDRSRWEGANAALLEMESLNCSSISGVTKIIARAAARPLTEKARAELKKGLEDTMERLTEYSDLAGVRTGDLKLGVDERKAFDRLAAYEDTGLEPEEIVDLQRAWDMYGGEEGITAMLTPSLNNPLTLEELREMDGEPVWVERRGRDFPEDREWALVFVDGGFCRTSVGNIAFFALYGIGWLAYRRKPEEGDDMTCETCQWFDDVNETCGNPDSPAYESPTEKDAVCAGWEVWPF